MRCALATRSANKAREIRQILHATGIELATLDELGCTYSTDEDSIEQHETFAANARAKALFFLAKTGLPTIADDSGLVIAALAGAPGVHSKRFAARTGLSGRELDRANIAAVLERLGALPAAQRSARFVCAAALALPTGAAYTFTATCTGQIIAAPRGAQGFGYDPVFLVPELSVTFGELDASEKNRRSHRARAFRTLASQLPTLLAVG